ncbi:MAG: iron ABC transporter permease [Spirochaetales bacterium]|nr:iron ABC transporter permease [Spirochaetales bacterium]
MPTNGGATIKPKRGLITLLLLLISLSLLSLTLGRYPRPGFSNPFKGGLMGQIVLNVRLPRLLLAIFGGASLAMAGFVFQMLFNNPLVEPGFLGVSQGAAFGAALAITLGGSLLIVQLSASLFGLLALASSYWLARKFTYGGWILRLVLAGITMGALYSAGLSIIKLVASPTTSLQDITFWMMGGLWNTTWQTLWSVMPTMLIINSLLLIFRWRVNLLSLDERTAHSIGIAINREKALLLFLATVATTSIISVAGLIGWVGLIIPHLARRLFGANARYALPASMLLGSLFLVASDTLGRALLSSEIPLGVLTSLVGALLFVLLFAGKRGEKI